MHLKSFHHNHASVPCDAPSSSSSPPLVFSSIPAPFFSKPRAYQLNNQLLNRYMASSKKPKTKEPKPNMQMLSIKCAWSRIFSTITSKSLVM